MDINELRNKVGEAYELLLGLGEDIATASKEYKEIDFVDVEADIDSIIGSFGKLLADMEDF